MVKSKAAQILHEAGIYSADNLSDYVLGEGNTQRNKMILKDILRGEIKPSEIGKKYGMSRGYSLAFAKVIAYRYNVARHLSVRATNCLANFGYDIRKLPDHKAREVCMAALNDLGEETLSKTPNFGEKSLAQVKRFIREKN